MGRKRVKPTREEIESMGENPFLTGFKVPTRTVSTPAVYDLQETGELIPGKFTYDNEKHVKIYTTPMNRRIIAGLTGDSPQLLLWIMMELASGQDYLMIDRTRYMQENNTKSLRAFYAGINELIRYELIRESPFKNHYFINPNYMFCGSRAKKYPKHVKHV